MSTTALEICNLALDKVRAKGRIASLDERSREAEIVSRWYPIVRRVVMEAAFWPGCAAEDELAQVGENRFALPSKMLRPRFLTSFAPVTILFSQAEGRMLLHSSEAAPCLNYTFDQEQPVFWTSEQRLATIYGLAAHIAGPLTGNTNIIRENVELANDILNKAQVSALNGWDQEERGYIPPEFAERGYTLPASATRHYYPFGSVFTVSATVG